MGTAQSTTQHRRRRRGNNTRYRMRFDGDGVSNPTFRTTIRTPGSTYAHYGNSTYADRTNVSHTQASYDGTRDRSYPSGSRPSASAAPKTSYGSSSGNPPSSSSTGTGSGRDLRSQTALKLKAQGNEHFHNAEYAAAADMYSQAIVQNPELELAYTNRALCYLKLGDFLRTESDCEKALELNSHSVKARYYMGQAAIQMHEYKRAISLLKRALDTSKQDGRSDEYLVDILESYWCAKKMLWKRDAEQSISNLCEWRSKCETILDDSSDDAVGGGPSSPEGNGDDVSDCSDNEEPLSMKCQVLNMIDGELDTIQSRLSSNMDLVPPYFVCTITMEVMKDPVITPSGLSYERSAISDHLRSVGSFDPVTREPLEAKQLVPNIALRDAIRGFMEENPWAYDD